MCSAPETKESFNSLAQSNIYQKEVENIGSWADYCHNDTNYNNSNINNAYVFDVKMSEDLNDQGWSKVIKKSGKLESKNSYNSMLNLKERNEKNQSTRMNSGKDPKNKPIKHENKTKSIDKNLKSPVHHHDRCFTNEFEMEEENQSAFEKQEFVNAPMPKINAWGNVDNLNSSPNNNNLSINKDNMNYVSLSDNESGTSSLQDASKGTFRYNISTYLLAC